MSGRTKCDIFIDCRTSCANSCSILSPARFDWKRNDVLNCVRGEGIFLWKILLLLCHFEKFRQFWLQSMINKWKIRVRSTFDVVMLFLFTYTGFIQRVICKALCVNISPVILLPNLGKSVKFLMNFKSYFKSSLGCRQCVNVDSFTFWQFVVKITTSSCSVQVHSCAKEKVLCSTFPTQQASVNGMQRDTCYLT